MKHLRKIFESNDVYEKYIKECFLDVSENPNFEVDDLFKVDLTEEVDYPITVYRIHIEEGDSIKIGSPQGTNPVVGKMKVDLNFLKNKQEKISELIEDIEVAINRIKEKLTNSETQIYINTRSEIDVVIIIKN